MELFDTHCHIDVEAFSADRPEVLSAARVAGLCGMLVPGIRADDWASLLGLCGEHDDLWPALGLHPVFMGSHAADDVARLEDHLQHHRVAAVGEIGLDYRVGGADRAAQKSLLETQLVIARDADLPVVLHVLKAHDDVLVLLKRVKVKGGFTHAFNGSVQQAQHYRDLGFCVGFGGMLTFERSTKLRHLAATLPMDMMVLETDAPDMTVSQHRGERNSPAYLPYCLEAMARVRDIDPQEIARITTTNARRVLNLGVTNVEGK